MFGIAKFNYSGAQQVAKTHHPTIAATASTTGCFNEDPLNFHQYEYPSQLYKSELLQHEKSLEEYDLDIYETFVESLESNKPNLELYKQQPYLTFSIRLKLIDFLLKMSIRLKILPFVFFRAVKIFDRYCSKRIVLLDQSQLIITTCLWIAAKLQGGNNHFFNLSNLDKLSSLKTINDLGYGSGGKYKGPTERFRLPKLHELVKLCGAKCKYDQGMFKQMEVHVLATLDWNFNDPSIEEFIIFSQEFDILKENEFFKIKEFLSYTALYSNELIDVDVIELGQVIMDLVNESLNLKPNDFYYQRINYPDQIEIEVNQYNFIKKNLIKSILNSSEFILKLFNSKGPQQFLLWIVSMYKDPYTPPPSANSSHHYHHQEPSSMSNNMSNNSAFSPLRAKIQSSAAYNSPVSDNSSSNRSGNQYSHPPYPLSNSHQFNFHSPSSSPMTHQSIAGLGISSSMAPKSAPPMIPQNSSFMSDSNNTTIMASPQPIFKPVVMPNLLKFSPNVDFLPHIITSNNVPPLHCQSREESFREFSRNQLNCHYNYKHYPQLQQHQHNSSQSSLSSTVSKDYDYGSIFEYDPRKIGISTPLSDEESPGLPLPTKKQIVVNIPSH